MWKCSGKKQCVRVGWVFVGWELDGAHKYKLHLCNSWTSKVQYCCSRSWHQTYDGSGPSKVPLPQPMPLFSNWNCFLTASCDISQTGVMSTEWSSPQQSCPSLLYISGGHGSLRITWRVKIGGLLVLQTMITGAISSTATRFGSKGIGQQVR